MSLAKSLRSWYPYPSSAPQGDIPNILACYGIPYGGLGFLSHALTYYTIVCLFFGKKPLTPWRPVKETGKFGIITGLVGALAGAILAIYTTAKCHAYWQLVFMGIWKFFFSTFNGLVGLMASPESGSMIPVLGVGMAGCQSFTHDHQ